MGSIKIRGTISPRAIGKESGTGKEKEERQGAIRRASKNAASLGLVTEVDNS
jgi:hypothetical protein